MYAYKNGVRTEYADTDKITANTTFVCDKLVLVEEYDITNLGSLGETLRSNRPDTGYTAKNLSGGDPIVTCKKTITIYDTGNVIEEFDYEVLDDSVNVEFSGYQLSEKKDTFLGGVNLYESGDGRAAQYYINEEKQRQMAFVSGYVPGKEEEGGEWTFRSYEPLNQGFEDVVVYDIEENDDVYFYADFMGTAENYTINLNENAVLNAAELVDKSDGVTYSIKNNILTVSGEAGDYICVKAKQKPQIKDVLYDRQTKTIGVLVKNKSLDPQMVNIMVAGYAKGKFVYADYIQNVSIAADSFTRVDVEDFEKGSITDIKAFIWDEGELSPVNLSKLGNIELYSEEDLTYGQETAVKRANQLTSFTFTPISKIVSATSSSTYGYFMPGETYQGIPYSSCEVNDKFICENVTFETFLSALANPDSVLYTKDIKSASNGSTYYGMVCNGFVRYCLGIDQRCNTQRWLEIPGMTVIAEKSKYTENDIKVGDILHAYGDGSNHVALITDIFRDKNGKIAFIEVSESIRQTCKRRVFSVAEYFSKYVKYRICRYDYLEDIPPFDEEQNDILYSGLDKIQPMIAVDNGDKSNYLEGETVVISSFRDGDNTIEIEKDGEVIETIDVTGYKKLSRNLEAGYYKVRLKDTDFVTEFCVCSYDVTFTKTTKKITINASSDMGELIHMDFRTGKAVVGGLATKGMVSLTDEEKTAGTFTKSIPSDAGGFKVYFRNKYGIWSHPKINL